MTAMTTRPPVPPFSREDAITKVRAAEDAWNSRDPERVSLAYSPDSRWRNRSTFLNGRQEIVEFLTQKWERELEYRLIKEMWAFGENRIAVRFAYESMGATASGTAPTGTRTGSSTRTASWSPGMPASTTCRSTRGSGGSTGRHPGGARTTTRA